MTGAPDDELETFVCCSCEATTPESEAEYVCEDDGPWCGKCVAEWRVIFAACEHQWEPHEGDHGIGSWCTSCGGFRYDEQTEQDGKL